jgi:hypothetical protein
MLPDEIEIDAEEQDSASNLKITEWDSATRYQGDAPERKWLVYSTILQGKASLLAAAGGVGKSFLLLDLCYRLATHSRGDLTFTAFGKLACGGAAVMLCAEDDSVEIHNRLQSFGELPAKGRLTVIPLPDVGGLSLFETIGTLPVTSKAFDELQVQIKAIPDLKLIVLDPLQALCGGLDLNLPQHSQHVCGALARLAVDTGAAVIVSHHLRKGGAIQTPDEARDAIRGSGGLVDGVRSAMAVWPDNSTEAEIACRKLSVSWERNRVCKMAVVKANFKADTHIKTLIRNDAGLLIDRSFDLWSITPSQDDIMESLVSEIEQGAIDGRPYTRNGNNGVFERRHELPFLFHDLSRNYFKDTIQQLLNMGRLSLFKLPEKPKSGATFLGMTEGVLSRFTVAVATVDRQRLNPATVKNPDTTGA